MTWEEFKNRELPEQRSAYREQTNIECPRCGKHIWKRLDIVLPSYPKQYQYECDCGWVGYDFK